MIANILELEIIISEAAMSWNIMDYRCHQGNNDSFRDWHFLHTFNCTTLYLRYCFNNYRRRKHAWNQEQPCERNFQDYRPKVGTQMSMVSLFVGQTFSKPVTVHSSYECI